MVRAWMPALLWMMVIFVGSTDLLSSQQTSRFLGPFLRWIIPGISDESIRAAQFVVRKCGHLAEYAFLAVLFHRALSLTLRTRLWNWRTAIWAFALAAGYAITDEIHQGLVATRYGSGIDVLIDSVGAAIGLAAVWAWHRFRFATRQAHPADSPANSAAFSRVE